MGLVFCKWEPVSLSTLLDAGEEVFVILDQWDREFGGIDQAVLDRAAMVYHISHFDALEELAGVAVDLRARSADIRRVASFAEFSQLGAGVLADLLQTEGFSLQLAVLTRDKRAMKERMRTAGIPCARTLSVPDPEHPPDPDTVTSAVGFPLVAKPVSGMGAMATSRIDDPGGLGDLAAAMRTAPGLRCRQAVLEEYIAGEEYHADAVWHDGEPLFFTVGRYPRPRLASGPGEEASLMINSADAPELVKAAEELHRRVNTALGIRSGATHFEFFRTGNGELIASEIATRFGGGPLIDMVKARDGVDLRQLWATELLRRPTAGQPTLGTWSHVAGLNIPPTGAGPVVAIPSADELAADPHVISHHVHCRPGQPATGPWALLLILGASSAAELVEVVADARSTYAVETAPTAEDGG